jgi:hypothetical protein
MISQSKASTDSLNTMLTGFQSRMGNTINIVSIVLVLFFLWLLAAQAVIFSQGYELFQGTASGMALSESDIEEQSTVKTEIKPVDIEEQSDSDEQPRIESETIATESIDSEK